MDMPVARPPRRWSWRIGSVAGIPIRVHVTLLFLLAWIGISYWAAGLTPRGSVAGILLIAIVFLIILVHELAHALMAKRFGVRTRDILLLPIGGISSLERFPEQPSQELAIAIVGPLVNVVLAGILWGVIALTGGPADPTQAHTLGQALLSQLMWINLVLAGFNLLPAFPLDGGRVLRALLAMRMPRDRATMIAATAGKVLAVVFAVFGMFFNFWLIAIALVVWLGAQRELEVAQLRTAFHGVPARAVMRRELEVVAPDESLEQAASRMIDAGTTALPVVDHGQIVGALTRADLSASIGTAEADGTVAGVPMHPVIRIPPDEPLDEVLQELERAPDAIAVVVDHGTPIGVVTAEQLAAYAALHPA